MAHATLTTPAVEVWRPVKGYEGIYEVSDLARVRSLDHYVEYNTKAGNHFKRFFKGKILVPKKDQKDQYLFVALSVNRKIKAARIHRLVAEAFIPNPDNLPCINHKDENKQNNLPSNLEWCTVLYNNRYGTTRERLSRLHSRRIEQLTLDGQHIAYFDSARQASKMLGIHESHIRCVVRGEQKTAHGYRWREVN